MGALSNIMLELRRIHFPITQWLSIWQSLSPLFDGFYLSIANETILGLNELSEGSSLTREELEAYYRVHDNSFVRHIRVALDGYMSGT